RGRGDLRAQAACRSAGPQAATRAGWRTGSAAGSTEACRRALATETRRAASRTASPADRELIGAGRGGAGRGRGGRNVAGREGALEQKLEIRALTVLHIVNMPGARGRILGPMHQADKTFGRIDITRL